MKNNTLLYLLVITIFLFVSSCEDKQWNNPYDSECPDSVWAPKSFIAFQGIYPDSLSYDEYITLTWEGYQSIDGHVIKRSVNGKEFEPIAELGNEKSSYVDSNIISGNSYKYLIHAKAGNNYSASLESQISPIFLPKINIEFIDAIADSVSCFVNVDNRGGQIDYYELIWSKDSTFNQIEDKLDFNGNPGTSFKIKLMLREYSKYYFRAAVRCISKIPKLAYSKIRSIENNIWIKNFDVSFVTANSIECNSIIISPNLSDILEAGVCWSTDSNPLMIDNYSVVGSQINKFDTEINDLAKNTVYYVKSFVVTLNDTIYSKQKQFKTLESENEGLMLDVRDGKEYRTIKIGDQVWMAENLGFIYSYYKDCYVYNLGNNTSSDEIHKSTQYILNGCLYRYVNYAKDVVKYQVPSGFHLPSKKEWETLIEYCGGYDIAGKKLKSTSGWDNGGIGLDEYKFNVKPSGWMLRNQIYQDMGKICNYWIKADEELKSGFEYVSFSSSNQGVSFESNPTGEDAFSVRCIKNKIE